MNTESVDLLGLLPWLPALGACLVFALRAAQRALGGDGAADVAANRRVVAVVVAGLVVVVAGLAIDALLRLATAGSFQYLGAGGFVGARFVSDLAPVALRPFVPVALEPLTGAVFVGVAVVAAAGVLGLASGYARGEVSGAGLGGGLLIEAAALVEVLADRPAHLVAAFAVVGVVGAVVPVVAVGGTGDGLVKVLGAQRFGDAALIVAMLALTTSLSGLSFEALLAGPPALEPWARVAGGAFDGVAHRTLWFIAGVGVVVGFASRGGVLSWPFVRDATANEAVPPALSGLVHGLAFHGAGAILLLRLYPVLALAPEAADGLVIAGGVTVVVASVLALAGRDLLRVDAHLLAAFSGVIAILAGTADVVGVALGALFVMAAGLGLPWTLATVARATSRRDPRELGGLEHKLPRTHSTRLLLTAGVLLPPFAGWVVVERAVEATVLSSRVAAGVVVAVVAGAFVLGVAGWRVLHLVFVDKARGDLEVAAEPPLAGLVTMLLVAFAAPGLSLLAIPRGLLNLSPAPIDYDPMLGSFMAPSLAESAGVRALFAAHHVAPPVTPSQLVLLVVALGLAPWLVALVSWRRGPRPALTRLGDSGPGRWLARMAGQDSAVARSVQESVERLSRLLAVNLVPATLSVVLQRLPQAFAALVAFIARVSQNGSAQFGFVIALFAVAAIIWLGRLP